MNDHWNIFTNDLEVRILKDYSIISQKFTIFYSSEYSPYYRNFSTKLTMVSKNNNFDWINLWNIWNIYFFMKFYSYDVSSEFNVYSDPVDTGVLGYRVAS